MHWLKAAVVGFRGRMPLLRPPLCVPVGDRFRAGGCRSASWRGGPVGELRLGRRVDLGTHRCIPRYRAVAMLRPSLCGSVSHAISSGRPGRRGIVPPAESRRGKGPIAMSRASSVSIAERTMRSSLGTKEKPLKVISPMSIWTRVSAGTGGSRTAARCAGTRASPSVCSYAFTIKPSLPGPAPITSTRRKRGILVFRSSASRVPVSAVPSESPGSPRASSPCSSGGPPETPR